MAVCISPTYTAVCLVLYLRLGASASQVGASGSTENLLALVGELQKQLQEEQSLKSVSGAAQALHDVPAAKPPSTAGPLLALTGGGRDEKEMDGIDGEPLEEQANSEVIEAVQKLHVEQSKKRADEAKEAEKINPVATPCRAPDRYPAGPTSTQAASIPPNQRTPEPEPSASLAPPAAASAAVHHQPVIVINSSTRKKEYMRLVPWLWHGQP